MRRSSVESAVSTESPPPSLSSVLKNNPLYGDVSLEDAMEERKKNPSWTVEEYDKHSLHTNLSGRLKVLVTVRTELRSSEGPGGFLRAGTPSLHMSCRQQLAITLFSKLECPVFASKGFKRVQISAPHGNHLCCTRLHRAVQAPYSLNEFTTLLLLPNQSSFSAFSITEESKYVIVPHQARRRPSRWQRSKMWRSPSSPQIHQKYIYTGNNPYGIPTERWQKTSDLPKGKKPHTYLGRAKE
ncbi:hypothetical protein BU61_1493 [Pontoporia blainvillei]|uniref:Major intrinsically disordered Notch2-binding receptor 1-like C-terminal domain-containing protein n=1 Tax=Pontoporia blainvillei TaxID=48723 RepID=A0ABX0S0C3_PONBL|nr:hypothetical protein [Pontoporia blainvillei]